MTEHNKRKYVVSTSLGNVYISKAKLKSCIAQEINA